MALQLSSNLVAQKTSSTHKSTVLQYSGCFFGPVHALVSVDCNCPDQGLLTIGPTVRGAGIININFPENSHLMAAITLRTICHRGIFYCQVIKLQRGLLVS